ncbi:MAG: polysaccharide deacetylase family protein [Planctomycetes bacterium]|nr:polysaccharide deacetylase family protein [Planctomycetota bacterium]
MAKILHRAARSRGIGFVVGALERLDARRAQLLRVLTYHRVDAPEPFRLQAEWLARNVPTVSIPDVLAALDGGPRLPPRAVLLTFDDAYRSFATHAWPALRALGTPAALFVPTAYPDSGRPAFWWDRVERGIARMAPRARVETRVGTFPTGTPQERRRSIREIKLGLKGLPHPSLREEVDRICAALGAPEEPHEVLGWDELRRLAREGVWVGAHTRTHPILTRLPPEAAEEEIRGSIADLEREIGTGPRVLAYPDGRCDEGVLAGAVRSGVALAFTMRRGTNALRRGDRLTLRRIHVDAGDSCAVLRARLLYSSVFLNPWRPLFDPQSLR